MIFLKENKSPHTLIWFQKSPPQHMWVVDCGTSASSEGDVFVVVVSVVDVASNQSFSFDLVALKAA